MFLFMDEEFKEFFQRMIILLLLTQKLCITNLAVFHFLTDIESGSCSLHCVKILQVDQ